MSKRFIQHTQHSPRFPRAGLRSASHFTMRSWLKFLTRARASGVRFSTSGGSSAAQGS